MAADSSSLRILAGRVKAVYENLPLPAPVVAAMALDLLLARLRPAPLPGPRSVPRMAGAGLVVAGAGLNAWALAERRRRSAGPFQLERPEDLVETGPYAASGCVPRARQAGPMPSRAPGALPDGTKKEADGDTGCRRRPPFMPERWCYPRIAVEA
jgi:hypothetical protein